MVCACSLRSEGVCRPLKEQPRIERQQRQRLRALREDRHLAHFIIEGRATGKQLGIGSYGSVEEVDLCLY